MILKEYNEGTKDRPYPHALVAGIERYPLKVTKSMGAKKLAKRSKVKPFIKAVNFNHIMPTRYALELDSLKGVVSNDTFKEVSLRENAKKDIKKLFEERYQSGKNRYVHERVFAAATRAFRRARRVGATETYSRPSPPLLSSSTAGSSPRCASKCIARAQV